MSDIEHDVWARKPLWDESRYIATFLREDWQFAEKFASYLESLGYLEVEVRTSFPGEEK